MSLGFRVTSPERKIYCFLTFTQLTPLWHFLQFQVAVFVWWVLWRIFSTIWWNGVIFIIALDESLYLGVQQTHRYQSSAPDCLSDILFTVSKARGWERIKGECESFSENISRTVQVCPHSLAPPYPRGVSSLGSGICSPWAAQDEALKEERLVKMVVDRGSCEWGAGCG